MKTQIQIPHTPGQWVTVFHDPKSDHPLISIQFPGYDGSKNGRPKAIDPFTIAHVNTEYFNPHLREPLANAHVMTCAPETTEALQFLYAHYQDIARSNPGFIGKLSLQDYELMNIALMKTEAAIKRLATVKNLIGKKS